MKEQALLPMLTTFPCGIAFSAHHAGAIDTIDLVSPSIGSIGQLLSSTVT
jgi:hypothetical protein